MTHNCGVSNVRPDGLLLQGFLLREREINSSSTCFFRDHQMKEQQQTASGPGIAALPPPAMPIPAES